MQLQRANLWGKFDKFPPILCRLMARIHKGRPLETEELSIKSGLSATTIVAISSQTDWRGIDVPTARSFLLACGMDFASPDQMRRVRQRLRKPLKTRNGRFKYLKLSPNYDSYFVPLFTQYTHYLRDRYAK